MSRSKFIDIWSSRGFIQSLTEDQRTAFINLSASHENTEAMVEQAQFENGHQPVAKTEILFAIRYAIKRQSASSSDVASFIEDNFEKFEDDIKQKIISEIKSGLTRTASKTDLKIWTNALLKIENKYEAL